MPDLDNELRDTFAHQVAPLDAQAPSPTYFRRIKRRKVVTTVGSGVAAVGIFLVLVASLGSLLPLGKRGVIPGGEGSNGAEPDQTVVLPQVTVTYPKAWFLSDDPDMDFEGGVNAYSVDRGTSAYLQISSRDDFDMDAEQPACPTQGAVSLWVLSNRVPDGKKPAQTPMWPIELSLVEGTDDLCPEAVSTLEARWFDPASDAVMVAVLRAGPEAPETDVARMAAVFDSMTFPSDAAFRNESAFDGLFGSGAYFVAAAGKVDGFDGEFGIAVWNDQDGLPRTELGLLPPPEETTLEPVMVAQEGLLMAVGVSSPTIARIAIESPTSDVPIAADDAGPMPSSFFGQETVIFALVADTPLPAGSELVAYDSEGTELSRVPLEASSVGGAES